MRNDTELADTGRQYKAAYAAHYTERDLPTAIHLYMKVVAAHPDAQEAGYARTQVANIVHAVVPKQALLDAQIQLALAHLQHEGAPEARRISVTPLVLEPST